MFQSQQFLVFNREWSLRQIGSTDQLFHSRTGKSFTLTKDTTTILRQCDGSSSFEELLRCVKPEAVELLTSILGQLATLGAVTVRDKKPGQVSPVQVTTYMGSQLKDLIIHVTGQCHSNCQHCYLKGPEKTTELTTAQLLELINVASGMGVMRVHLTGGEPFLRDDLGDLLYHLRGKHICLGSIYTDGTLVAKNMALLAQIKADHSPTLYISIDGLEHSHDLFREDPGSFRRALAGIRTLHEFGFPVVINTALNQLNREEMLVLFDMLQDLQVARWHVFNCSLRGKWIKNVETLGISLEQEARIYHAVLQKWMEDGKPFELDLGHFFRSVNKKGRNSNYTLGSYACCDLYKMACTVWPNGDVTPCGMVYESHIVGNITRESFRDIWESTSMRYYKSLRIQDIIPERCRSCQYLSWCGMGCRGNSHRRGLNFEAPDPDMCQQFINGNYNNFRGLINHKEKQENDQINIKFNYKNREWLPLSQLNNFEFEKLVNLDTNPRVLCIYKIVKNKKKISKSTSDQKKEPIFYIHTKFMP